MEEYGNFKSNGFWKIVSGACWLSGFYLFAEFCFSVGGRGLPNSKSSSLSSGGSPGV